MLLSFLSPCMVSESYTFLPSEPDRAVAKDSSRALVEFAGHASTKKPALSLSVDGRSIPLPAPLLYFLTSLLTETAKGNAVTLVPIHAELTTQQAADFLNVSRPYLIQLIEEGKIQHRKVGTHRRILFGHLQAYKRAEDARSAAAMDELAKQAQELKMGY